MPNTFDSALVTDVARKMGITVLQNKLAMLNLFSKDFSADPIAPKKTVQVPKVTGGATAQTNPTNYESGDSTVDNIAVAPDELSVSFHITSAQLQQGFRLEQLLAINLQVLANKCLDTVAAIMTTSNFGSAVFTGAAADFGVDDLKTIYAAAKNYNTKNLVLDGSYLANFIPTDKLSFALGEQGAYGFDRIAMNNRWSAAGANVVGGVFDSQAIGIASGVPIIDDAIANQMLLMTDIALPDLGMTVRFCVWGALASRAVWGSYGVMLGAALGDDTAGEVLTSA